jgi:hypothetical protein
MGFVVCIFPKVLYHEQYWWGGAQCIVPKIILKCLTSVLYFQDPVSLNMVHISMISKDST